MGGVSNDVVSSLAQAVSINCAQIWELSTYNPLWDFDYLYQVSWVLCSATGVPHHDTVVEYICCVPVEVY